jgi:hypothetical protein
MSSKIETSPPVSTGGSQIDFTNLAVASPLKHAFAEGGGIFADLNKLRLSYGEVSVGTKELVVKIPVRKPTRQEWIRTRLDEKMTLVTNIYEDKDTRETHFIAPNMVGAMQALGEATPAKLVPAVTRQGVALLIPAKLPTEGTSMTVWHDTIHAAIERAETSWVRISADMALGGYRIFEAMGNLGEPKFPEMSLNEMLEIGFKGRIIDSEDHPIFKKLVGRV